MAYAEKVAAAEPDFPLGYIGIADSYLLLGEFLYLSPTAAFPPAREAAEQALRLETGLSEGFASLAEYFFYYERDWIQAEKYYRRAIEINPDYATARHWYTWFLCAMKRFDEALAQIEEAQKLDPNSLILSTIRGMPFYYKKQFERAITQFRSILEIEPDFTHARYYLGSSLAHVGQVADAIAEFEKISESEPMQQSFALLGYCYAVAGREREALTMLAKLDEIENQRYVSPYIRAFIHTGLGETEQALTLLEKAFEEKAAWLVWLNVDPFFARLHNQKRFKTIIGKLNLS